MQQRIGEIVSQYETQIAVYRAEITQLTEKINEFSNQAAQENPDK